MQERIDLRFSEAQVRFYQFRGAAESYDADVHATVYAADKRIQQKARESHVGAGPVFHVLQLLPGSPDLASYPCNGSGNSKSRLGR